MSTFNNMVDFIKSAFPARKYIVPCLKGPSGIGKTMACKKAAEELGVGKVVTIIASQVLPNEVSGITMPVPESKAMEIFDHYRLSSLEDGDILFFDELLEADQLVLSACLTLIESRELMSGKKLPDILIVAATNETVLPTQLKESIRQRFLWRDFGIDPDGCRQYIIDTCGFDVGEDIANKLVQANAHTHSEYNILTPRSLTKMAQWIADASDEHDRTHIAVQINSAWNNNLGTNLLDRYRRSAAKKVDPDKVKVMLRDVVEETGLFQYQVDIMNEKFENSTVTEIVNWLKQSPQWSEIEKTLNNRQATQ